ncbi:M24 family metallopeptidase [Leptolyngbya sp. FACHB-541]|uniref:M24 family metallopeptidase n=1 Tax=Leptolyngbya sp. FACHB-541 TaxID=2692810 RepID=UPI00168260DF|nr:M24 family metallopeptidase [Leptolyngbya sp. FACHB-541]MBD2001086.1 M24 family metallopeptidase [Leptolyngbya sp. FACHB-541]
MAIDETLNIEAHKDNFLLEDFLAARAKTWEAINRISERIYVGMLEEEANEIVKTTLQEMGTRQGWHKPYVHFGLNTTKTLFETPEPGVKLGENDIYFIDIAPVWNGYEGDAGHTFVTGSNPELKRCALDTKRIFGLVADKWRTESTSGQALYEFAAQIARELGWILNLRMDGHRLADFPHTAYHAGKLSAVPFHPSPNLWVLEIQIRHPDKSFGGFYEDILM